MRTTFTHLASISAVAFAAADSGKGTAPVEAETPAVDLGAKMIAVTDTDKVEAIGKAMRSRKVYDNFESAYAALTKASGDTDEFYGLPVVIVGHDRESNEVDPAVYDGHRAALAYVGARIRQPDGKFLSGIKAVTIFPIPTVEAFMAEEAGAALINKILEKESAHVTFRNFRDAETLADLFNGADAAPKSVIDFATASTREGSELDTETFDALWTGLRNTLKANKPALVELLPGKGEVLKCIRSKSYALADSKTAPLEEADVFAKLGTALVNGAAANKSKDGSPAPLDSSAITAWLEGRDTLEIKRAEERVLDFSVLKGGALDF